VLMPGQVRDEQALPGWLVREDIEAPLRVPEDGLWAAYFYHAYDVGRRVRSAFLEAWVAYEVSLRNALAEARAKALSLEPSNYLVAEDLGAGDEDFTSVLSEWAAATTPLAGLQALDKQRWSWLDEHDGWFTFEDDEFAAYAVKLMLLNRWYRLAHSGEKDSAR